MRPLRILILHSLGDPSRSSIFLKNHVFALRICAPEHDYLYHDTTLESPASLIDEYFDAVILDVTFLWARWAAPSEFNSLKKSYEFVRDWRAIKIAFPQDEYDCNELLDDWLCDWNVDIVYSVISENRDILYPRYSKTGDIRLGFTGYITDSLLYYKPSPLESRPIDIGYRAAKLPPYFGILGETKWRIGKLVQDRADKLGFVTDIGIGEESAIIGVGWLDFINDSKFTLGANSGSSLLDPRGEIQRRVRDYVAKFSTASFEEVERACFSGLDGRYEFTAISPRIIEAGMLESCQILVEGEYSGILSPWDHYIPIKPDASDFSNVVEAMKDRALCSRLIENCKSTLLGCPGLRQAFHVKQILADISRGARRFIAPQSTVEFPVACDFETNPKDLQDLFKPRVLLLCSHEPERDPRLNWIAQGAQGKFIVDQLGVSRVPNDPPKETGSVASGFVWSVPRTDYDYDLGIIKEIIKANSRVLLEFSALISIKSLSDRELIAVLGCDPSERIQQFRWYLRYILIVSYSLLECSARFSNISCVIATDLDTLLAGALLKERYGIPLVYDAHEFWPAADILQEKFEEDFWISLERRLLSHVDYAQTVSPGLAKHMSGLYGRSFFYTPNAEPLASFIPPDFSEVFGSHGGTECRFIFHGGFAAGRGIDLLINVWPYVAPSAKLLLRGQDNDYKNEMIGLAESLGLIGDRVVFLDAVSEDQLVSEASKCDVGLIPYTPTGLNYGNCCPNKMSQYMAAGLPILANKTNFVEKIVDDSGAGSTVDFRDTGALIKEIDKFALDVSFRKKCSMRSARYFVDKFHWEKVSAVFYARVFSLSTKEKLSDERSLSYCNGGPLIDNIVLPEITTDSSIVVEPPKNGVIFYVAKGVWHLIPGFVRSRLITALRRRLG